MNSHVLAIGVSYSESNYFSKRTSLAKIVRKVQKNSESIWNMPRVSKLLRLMANLVFLISIHFFLTRTYFSPTLKKKLSRYQPDIKYLLLWTKIHGLKENGQKPFLEKKCFNFNCYVTGNRNLLGDIRFFDGIIFNLQDVSQGMQELPDVRIYSQKYIFAANDSSDNFPVCDPVYENFFNWTWTYKWVNLCFL